MQFDPNKLQPFDNLPDEVIIEIFSSLPLSDLAAASPVSWRWYAISNEVALKKIGLIWEIKMKAIDAIPNKKYRKLELIYSHLDGWNNGELHRKLGERIRQFVVDHSQPPSDEFESYIDLNNPYWKFFLRGHLERLHAEHQTIDSCKTLTLNIREDINNKEWDEVDAVVNEFPTQTNRLVLQLISKTAPAHTSPSKLPLQLFKQSKCLEEMGVTVSQRLAFSVENFTQISQLILDKQEDAEAANIHTLTLTFNHLDKDHIFDFIRTLEPLSQPLTIIFCQVFGHNESCSALHYHTMGLDYLRREVNPMINLEFRNQVQIFN